jgi:formylglycine-generating enzyme required for sulfatase activity
MVRLIRIFVSSPGDVQAERDLLETVVAQIDRSDGDRLGVALRTFRWEKDVVPKIGPRPQHVVDDQTPPCDIYLGIMASRFGTPTASYGSGTEQEFYDAIKRWGKCGKPWILFYFHKDPPVPRTVEEGRQFLKVLDFKARLDKMGITAEYDSVKTGEHSFMFKVTHHLRDIIYQLEWLKGDREPQLPTNPTAYLADLQAKTEYIDIRGLVVGKGQAHRFPIEALFISLTTTQGPTKEEEEPGKRGRRNARIRPTDARAGMVESRTVPLQHALRSDRLVVIGDPGAGKTTFLRRVAHTLCQTQLGEVPDAALERLAVSDRTFPILVRVSEWAQHLVLHGNDPAAPTGEDAPAWLTHYLTAASKANKWGLDVGFFEQQLEGGLGTVLLDGLDEAPDLMVRERLSRLIENVARAYQGCRFVLTCRPAAYTGAVILPDFTHARIDPLSDEAVETFLFRWCTSLYQESAEAAREHCDELLAALRARPDIRRMARTPVMLTALAVVHWNERRLPEQRADLYESITRWLSRSREQRAGRVSADRTVVLLQELALAMQDDPEGRKTQVPKRWAAEKIAAEFGDGKVSTQTVARATRFLDEEEVDSGIVVGRGHDVTFWHLTFQEFLAAKAVASRLDDQQKQILFSDPHKVYSPDWREVVLLLAGALHEQGRAKVDGLVSALLDGLGKTADLAEQARCAGLLGSVLRDLEPLKYQITDTRYDHVLDAVMAIFDRQRAEAVPIETRIAAGDALGQAGDPRLDAHRAAYWVEIPASTFLMGAQSIDPKRPHYDPESTDEDEWRETPHEVYVDAYEIARYPVTVGQYEDFVADDGYEHQRWWQAGGFGDFSSPGRWDEQVQYRSRPVTDVSWYEAAAYCAWAGWRLPTEAEWERATRGTQGRRYPWGDQSPTPSYANYYSDSGVGHPTPVGIFPMDATPEGMCDVAGNVWEWCVDWFAAYAADPVSNPCGPRSGSSRVIRGGSWYGTPQRCRLADRSRGTPEYRLSNLGFRVARSSAGT